MVRFYNDELSTNYLLTLLKKYYYKLYIGFGIFFMLSHIHKNYVSVYDKKASSWVIRKRSNVAWWSVLSTYVPFFGDWTNTHRPS